VICFQKKKKKITSVDTSRRCSRSSLLPAKAIIIPGLACLCNSLTQDFAFVKEAYF